MRTLCPPLLLAPLLCMPAWADIPVANRIRPLCGNSENGIVVGKPKLFDDRSLALLIDSLESRLAKLQANKLTKTADVQAEEIQLSYQLLNLRSLSDKALTDRVILNPSRGGSQAVPRAQALIGFQVSLDPREKYAGAVADVEVTLVSKGEQRSAPNLVVLLPREKTYNFASAGAGGVVVKDSDTIGLERLSPTREQVKGCNTAYKESDRDLTVAWEFKPVLGRDSVEAGTRQVYALIALPTGLSEEFLADVHVHTHWRALKKVKRKNAGDAIEESLRDELWPDAIRYNQSEMEAAIRPRIQEVKFLPNGPSDFVVMAEGDNFLSDTTITMGGTRISAPNLTVEREKHLQFVAPAVSLTQQDLFVTGRFGTPVPFLDPRATQAQFTSDPTWGLKIEYARARPKNSETSEVRIKIKSRQRKKPVPEMIVNRTLVSAAGRILPVSTVETEPTDADALLMRFDFPTQALRASRTLTVSRLFGGELYRDTGEITLEDDITATKVSLMSATEEEVTIAVSGSGFTSLAVIQIGGTTYSRWTKPALTLNSPSMLTLKLPRRAIQGNLQLTLEQGFAQPIILPLPDLNTAGEASRAKPHRRPTK